MIFIHGLSKNKLLKKKRKTNQQRYKRDKRLNVQTDTQKRNKETERQVDIQRGKKEVREERKKERRMPLIFKNAFRA